MIPHPARPKIREFMTPLPVTIEADASLEQAISLMSQENLRHLPVQKDKELVGIVSDRDLRARLADPSGRGTVEEAMTPLPYTVSPEEEMQSVLETMAANKLGSVIVQVPGNPLEGIFTTTDALRLLARRMAGERDDLRPNQPNRNHQKEP